MQEFLQNNIRSENLESDVVKTKFQEPRGRRRSSRTRTTRKSRGTGKAKKELTNVTHEAQLVAVKHDSDTVLYKSGAECPSTQQAVNSMQLVPGCQSEGDTQRLTRLMYAERMREYIARTLTEDNDECRTPPTLHRVLPHSSSTSVSVLASPAELCDCRVELENICRHRADDVASSAARCTPAWCSSDGLTPCCRGRGQEIHDESPPAKRRLFDVSCVGRETQHAAEASRERGGITRETTSDTVRPVGHQNGYHTVHQLLTSSLNGKSLGPVEHYEDGLLAIANAACLMSTRASGSHHSQDRLSEEPGQCCNALLTTLTTRIKHVV